MIALANSFYNSIKFTVDISSSKNVFLDTSSKQDDEKEYSLNTKPYDYHLYLKQLPPPYNFKGIPKLSNNLIQTNLMKSLMNTASYQNPICLIKVIKPTKCNLQLIKLLQKTRKLFCNTKRKQTKAGFRVLLPITPPLQSLKASLKK